MRWIRIYKSGLHQGEESLVAGNAHAGMINFSGCHLACRFCYTPETSVHRFGEDYSPEAFRDLLDGLVRQGAGNINLISPSHEWPGIEDALADFKQSNAHIPLVVKVSGYESQPLVLRMTAVADVLVPDFKVFASESAKQVNLPSNYGVVASNALARMAFSHQPARFDGNGHMSRGILVRHLLMPGFDEDSRLVIEALGEIRYKGSLNLMTRFLCPSSPGLKVAAAPRVSALRTRALELGMHVLVDGAESEEKGTLRVLTA